jgi:hypothetical protein
VVLKYQTAHKKSPHGVCRAAIFSSTRTPHARQRSRA